jgi:molybdopterin-guanine dinucleotide biosynthesis protein A
LVVDGQSIRDRQLAALGGAGLPIMIVGSSGDASDVPPGITTVSDLDPGKGPMGALWTALTLAPTARVFAVAADMPFVTAELVSWLVRQGGSVDIAVPRTRRGLEPLCATYSRAAAPLLRETLNGGQLSLHEFIATSRDELRVIELGESDLSPFDPHGRLFFNINSPADYTRALELQDGALGGERARPAPHTAAG